MYTYKVCISQVACSPSRDGRPGDDVFGDGETPIANLLLEIDSGYAHAGGVYLAGEAGNDNEWRIAA